MTESSYKSEALLRREDRVGRAQKHVREALEMLSAQVNDEEMIGSAPTGIKIAEQSCRDAVRALASLATNRDVRSRS